VLEQYGIQSYLIKMGASQEQIVVVEIPLLCQRPLEFDDILHKSQELNQAICTHSEEPLKLPRPLKLINTPPLSS